MKKHVESRKPENFPFNEKITYYYIRKPNEYKGISLQENVLDYNNKFIVAWMRNTPKKLTGYMAFDSPQECWKEVIWPTLTQGTGNNFYECMPDRWQKLHFDIDIGRDKIHPDHFNLNYANLVRDTLIKTLIQFFKQELNHELSLTDDVLIFTSHGVNVFSYHIIVDHYAFPGAIYCKHITKKLQDRLPLEMRPLLDLSVNKGWGLFRMFLSTKDEHPPRPKLLEKTWSYFGNLIAYNPHDMITDPRVSGGTHLSDSLSLMLYYERSLVTRFNGHETKIHYKLPDTPIDRPRKNLEVVGNVNERLLEEIIPKGWTLGTRDGNFYSLLNDRSQPCPVCSPKRIHEHQNQYLFIKGGKQQVYFCCYRASDLESKDRPKLLGILNSSFIPQYSPIVQPSESLMMDGLRVVRNFATGSRKTNWVTATEEDDASFVSQMKVNLQPNLGEILLIDAYLGTGKTTHFIEITRKPGRTTKVLLLSPRILYARAMTAEYNKQKKYLSPPPSDTFKCYLDPHDIRNDAHLVLSMESLYKVAGQQYDILILDEIETLLTQFSSWTMKEQIRCAQVFAELVVNTPIVVGGDAFLSNKSKRTLELITNRTGSLFTGLIEQPAKNVRIIRNTHLSDKRKAVMMKTWSELTSHLFDNLVKGKRIVFACAGYKKACSIAEECKRRGVIFKLYTKDNSSSEEARFELSNVNEAWSSVQLVIYTPTITVGVNFDLPDYFDQLFVYGSAFSCTVRDLFQMTLRVRHLRENVMYFAIQSTKMFRMLPTEESDIIARIDYFCVLKEQLLRTDPKNLIEFKGIFSDKDETETHVWESWKHAPTWLKICHVLNILEQNQSKTDYHPIFMAYLARCNYELYHAEIANPGEIDEYQESYPYDAIETISEPMYQDLLRKMSQGSVTAYEMKMIKKFQFDQKISPACNPEKRAELYNKYFNSGSPVKESHFHNTWDDKFSTSEEVLRRQVEKKYIECTTNGGLKHYYIKQVQNLVGFDISVGHVTFCVEELCLTKISLLQAIIPQLINVFEMEINVDPNNVALMVSHVIQKAFDLWNAPHVTSQRHRPRTGGKQINLHLVNVEYDNVLLNVLVKSQSKNGDSSLIPRLMKHIRTEDLY